MKISDEIKNVYGTELLSSWLNRDICNRTLVRKSGLIRYEVNSNEFMIPAFEFADIEFNDLADNRKGDVTIIEDYYNQIRRDNSLNPISRMTYIDALRFGRKYIVFSMLPEKYQLLSLCLAIRRIAKSDYGINKMTDKQVKDVLQQLRC